MRPRHRIPTIFTISMVDMLCCSLGCVILLWLIKADKLQQMQARNSDAQQQLAQVSDDLEQTKKILSGREEELELARKHLALVDADAASLRIKLDASKVQAEDVKARLLSAEDMLQLLAQLFEDASSTANARKLKLAELEKILAAFKDQNKDMQQRLNLAAINYDDLQKKLAAADLRVKQLALLADQLPDLKDDLKKMRDRASDQETLADSLKRQLDQRGRELADAEKKFAALQAEKIGIERSLVSALAYRDRLAVADDALKKLQKDHDDRLQELSRAQGDLAALTKERATLEKENSGLARERDNWRREVDRVQREADNRFAGINLTGTHVVFLVDMSGSMDYIDEDTRSPNKWKSVCETVRKILKTLPKPEKIQVIAFSDKVIFPLGSEGKWLDFDPAVSPDKAFTALKNIQPKAGTNMYMGLEAAFRFRDQGLDAIYFLSDGLPNVGQGLTDEQARKLSETEKADILGKYIRKKLLADWNREQPGKPRIVVNTIGFFYESPDVGAFLWALSRENRGSFVGMSEP